MKPMALVSRTPTTMMLGSIGKGGRMRPFTCNRSLPPSPASNMMLPGSFASRPVQFGLQARLGTPPVSQVSGPFRIPSPQYVQSVRQRFTLPAGSAGTLLGGSQVSPFCGCTMPSPHVGDAAVGIVVKVEPWKATLLSHTASVPVKPAVTSTSVGVASLPGPIVGSVLLSLTVKDTSQKGLTPSGISIGGEGVNTISLTAWPPAGTLEVHVTPLQLVVMVASP